MSDQARHNLHMAGYTCGDGAQPRPVLNVPLQMQSCSKLVVLVGLPGPDPDFTVVPVVVLNQLQHRQAISYETSKQRGSR